MRHVYLFLLYFLLWSSEAMAQVAILPGDTDTLNYTQVLFEMPYHPGAATYELIITNKTYPAGNITAKTSRSYFIVTSGLHFNNTYLWQYKCYNSNGTNIYTSPTSTLHIEGTWQADSNRYRNRIQVNDSAHIMQGYVLLDNGSIMNRKGEVVWTFPKDKFGTVRDLEFTKEGTLTFLWDGSCYETDLRGNILWRSPDSALGYKLTDYHHEFTKLDNGNYLCMARRIIPGDNSTVFSIVFETDKRGNIQWLWDEKQYYSHETNFAGSHLNAAYYDTKEKRLYISNRDLSSIARINTHKAMIEYSLGYDYQNSVTAYYPQEMFGRQHAVSILPDNDLLLFNNNYPGKTSSVIIMSQPRGKKAPRILWEYTFNFDDPTRNYVSKCGNAQILPNGDILICMGANNTTIEASRDKKIVWQAEAEQYDSTTHTFRPVATGYRADITTSLYPCYFTAHTHNDDIIIENAGIAENKYTCRFRDADGIEQTVTSRSATAGETIRVHIPDKKIKPVAVEITSSCNNELVKRILL